MSRIKGTSWESIYEFFYNKYGVEGIHAVKDVLGQHDRDNLFLEKIYPTSWVDFGSYTRFILTADTVLGKGDLELAREANSYSARREIRGIYRLFFKVLSVKFILKKANYIWKMYFDEGEFVIEKVGPKVAVARLTGYKQLPKHHEINQLFWVEEVLRMAGVKNPKGTHPKCLIKGDDCCIYHFTWD